MSEKMNNNTAILVENLSKRYTIGMRKDESFRGALASFFNRKSSNSSSDFWAVKDVSFEIHKGDVVGIIGRNGAGKSTLLKLLSQITRPTEGKIHLNGRVASLLEVGTGFHQELTGRENIYLNGTILGMTREEVKSKFDEIVAFSGVEKFIDTPVKHYSSGMYVRLAFAVAAHLEPEILIIDEVLAVGDAEFQKKCLGKMQDVAGEGRTVLFVSHSMAAIKSLCNKGILLQNGVIQNAGPIDEIISSYLSVQQSEKVYLGKQSSSKKDAFIKRVEVIQTGESDYTCEDEIHIEFQIHLENPSNPYNLFVTVIDQYQQPVFSSETKISSEKLVLRIHSNFLARGNYSIQTFIHIPNIEQIDRVDGICPFTILDTTSDMAIHGTYNYGVVFGNCKWDKQ